MKGQETATTSVLCSGGLSLCIVKAKQNVETTCFSYENEPVKLTFLIDFKHMAENYSTIGMQISLSISPRKNLIC